MPAKRSRTQHWRQCLQQIHDRNGAIEIAVARDNGGDPEAGNHLVWRVRVLEIDGSNLIVEQPSTLGQIIPLRTGIELVGILAVGQNRWLFNTTNLGMTNHALNSDRSVSALRLRMPDTVERCQRRNFYRVETAAISLPAVVIWPLLDPQSVVLAERANELQFQRDQQGGDVEITVPELARVDLDDIMPEVGPRFNGTLLNIGGGGLGLNVAPEHSQDINRHKVFWLRFSLPPELNTPICATAKLAHTHMQSDHSIYAGLAFDFSFNAAHQGFVVDQICKCIAVQQRLQLQRLRVDDDERRIA